MFHDRLSATRLQELFALRERATLWVYVGSPIVLALRLAVVAGLTQLGLLAFGEAVPFGKLFRVALFAYLAILASDVARTAYLASFEPDQLTRAALGHSVGALPLPAAAKHALPRLTAFLAPWLTLFELGWCAVLFFGLRRVVRARWKAVAAGVAALWLSLSILEGLTVQFLFRILT